MPAGWSTCTSGCSRTASASPCCLYLGARLGPGPRDGLMTGYVARHPGRSVRLVRTVIEVAVLSVGWLLGGTVGVGTVLYALAIGPLAQFFIPLFTVPPAAGRPQRPVAGPVDGPVDGAAGPAEFAYDSRPCLPTSKNTATHDGAGA